MVAVRTQEADKLSILEIGVVSVVAGSGFAPANHVSPEYSRSCNHGWCGRKRRPTAPLHENRTFGQLTKPTGYDKSLSGYFAYDFTIGMFHGLGVDAEMDDIAIIARKALKLDGQPVGARPAARA